jgi:PAS domain S-box-containing protein
MKSNKNRANLIAAFVATIMTAVVLAFLFFYIGINHRRYSYEDSKLLAKEMSRKAAAETENYFTSALMIARSMAQRGALYQRFGVDRSEIVEMLNSSLKRSPIFLAAWTMWEPNAYDGKDRNYAKAKYYDEQGHLSVTFFRFRDSIHYEHTQPADYLKEYYTTPKATESELIIEPYYYQYTGHPYIFFETSVVVPITLNSKFAGVFAIDINLDSLQRNLNKVRLYGQGYLSLISNNGVIVSHIDSSLVNQNIYSILNPTDSITPSIIREGHEYSIETVSEFTGKKVFRFFYPINIGRGGMPWSMMVEIPINAATTRSQQLQYVAFGILLLGFSLIIYLIVNIFDRRRYERTILEAIERVEESNRIITESERNYREIFNSTSEAIFIIDAETGKILDVNDIVLHYFGCDGRESLINNSIANLGCSNTPPYTENEYMVHINRAPVDSAYFFEWQVKLSNGWAFWLEISIKRTSIGGVGRILAVARDITEKKKAALELENYRNNLELLVQERTEELSAANEELSSINEELYKQHTELEETLSSLQQAQRELIQSEKMASLGVLAAGVAHEINNPLNFIYAGITGIDAYLKENTKEQNADVAPLVQGVFEGVKRAAAIVSSLSRYSRSDDAHTSNCDLHLIVDNCLVMLQNQMKNRIEVVKNYTNHPYNFKCIESKMHQAILNVLANAAQSIEGKGEITITTSVKASKLSLIVSDSGCGISPENMSKILDPFFTTKEPGKGTGLGLYITYNIIHEHGGTIEFESEVGKGTKVIVEFPIVETL